MNIFEYVKDMAKGFTRGNIMSEIAIARDTVNNTVLPVYEDNLDFLRTESKKFTSGIYTRTFKDIDREFRRHYHTRNPDLFDLIVKGLRNSTEILSFLEGYFSKGPSDELTASSLTIGKATALQMLGAIVFAARYARGWLEMILSTESNRIDGINEESELTQLQIKYINENLSAFAITLAAVSRPVTEIQKIIEDIPEVIVAESNPRVISATLGKTADPFNFGFVQSKWNPFFLYGILRTDYLASKYKADVAESQLVQMKIYRLKAKLEERPDPKMESVIIKYQAELDKLRGRTHRMEQQIK